MFILEYLTTVQHINMIGRIHNLFTKSIQQIFQPLILYVNKGIGHGRTYLPIIAEEPKMMPELQNK